MGGSGGGGSGGGSYFPRTPEKNVESLTRRAQEQAERDRGDAEANQTLLSLLSQYNERDTDVVAERLESLLDSIGSGIEVEKILFGGSVAKHTYVDGLSDVDALVVLDDTETDSPSEVRSAFRSLLERRLPMRRIEGIREGDLAVTVTYTDGMEIQLLPAVRSGQDLAIAESSGERWSHVRPRAFQERLRAVNQAQSSAVVPTIKLAKSAIANLPDDRRLSGYHVEALAVEVFRDYQGRKTPVAMLRHFVAEAAERVRTPIPDPTGQSRSVDEYLGPVGSTARKLVSDSLATLSRQLRAARTAERWKELIDGE